MRIVVFTLAVLAGCASGPPVFDTKAITITYPQGYNQESRSNGASWEYWDSHPTYLLMEKEGASIRLPGNRATSIERKEDTIILH